MIGYDEGYMTSSSTTTSLRSVGSRSNKWQPMGVRYTVFHEILGISLLVEGLSCCWCPNDEL